MANVAAALMEQGLRETVSPAAGEIKLFLEVVKSMSPLVEAHSGQIHGLVIESDEFGAGLSAEDAGMLHEIGETLSVLREALARVEALGLALEARPLTGAVAPLGKAVRIRFEGLADQLAAETRAYADRLAIECLP